MEILVNSFYYQSASEKQGGEQMRGSLVMRVLVNALAIFVVANYLPIGLTISGLGSALMAAFILGIVNAIIRPIIFFFTLPINILTIGLFTFVINGLMLSLASKLVSGMHVDGILSAIGASIFISIVSMLINSLVYPEKRRR